MPARVAPAVFDVYDAVLAGMRSRLAGWNVCDGYPVTSDPSDFVAVGVSDPFSSSAAPSAQYAADWNSASCRTLDESGEVTVVAVAVDGGGDPAPPRDRIRALVTLVDEWLRSVPAPFGLPYIWQVRLSSVAIEQDQTTAEGALCIAVLTIAYRARI